MRRAVACALDVFVRMLDEGRRYTFSRNSPPGASPPVFPPDRKHHSFIDQSLFHIFIYSTYIRFVIITHANVDNFRLFHFFCLCCYECIPCAWTSETI